VQADPGWLAGCLVFVDGETSVFKKPPPSKLCSDLALIEDEQQDERHADRTRRRTNAGKIGMGLICRIQGNTSSRLFERAAGDGAGRFTPELFGWFKNFPIEFFGYGWSWLGPALYHLSYPSFPYPPRSLSDASLVSALLFYSCSLASRCYG